MPRRAPHPTRALNGPASLAPQVHVTQGSEAGLPRESREWVGRHFRLREDTRTLAYLQKADDDLGVAAGVLPLAAYDGVADAAPPRGELHAFQLTAAGGDGRAELGAQPRSDAVAESRADASPGAGADGRPDDLLRLPPGGSARVLGVQQLRQLRYSDGHECRDL